MCCGGAGAREFASRVASLRHAPRELWLVYVLKFLESFSYFSTSLNFALYLSDEFGYDDVGAGAWYGVWGVLISVYGLPMGFVIDRIGVRWSLVVGGSLSVVGRAMFALAPSRWLMAASVALVMPLGLSMGVPVMTIALKRYTVERNRTVAYALFYAAMNIGAVVSGPVTDAISHAFAGGVRLEASGVTISALRLVLLTGVGATAAYVVIATAAFREISVTPSGVVQHAHSPTAAAAAARTPRGVRATLSAALRDRVYYQLVLFSAVLIGARSIFRHLDATFPKYLQRELGTGVAYGTVYSLEPALIIVLVPLFAPVLAAFDPYTCIVAGTLVTSLATFVLCAPASYAVAVVFVVAVSLGEAVYSARVSEYAMMLAPDGSEGVYSMLAAAPLYVPKLLVGLMSGALLSTFCPSPPAERRCELMWLIVGALSLTTPVLLCVFRKCIHTDAVRRRMACNRGSAAPRAPSELKCDTAAAVTAAAAAPTPSPPADSAADDWSGSEMRVESVDATTGLLYGASASHGNEAASCEHQAACLPHFTIYDDDDDDDEEYDYGTVATRRAASSILDGTRRPARLHVRAPP